MIENTLWIDAIIIYGCLLAFVAIVADSLYESFRYTRLYDKLMAFFSRS